MPATAAAAAVWTLAVPRRLRCSDTRTAFSPGCLMCEGKVLLHPACPYGTDAMLSGGCRLDSVRALVAGAGDEYSEEDWGDFLKGMPQDTLTRTLVAVSAGGTPAAFVRWRPQDMPQQARSASRAAGLPGTGGARMSSLRTAGAFDHHPGLAAELAEAAIDDARRAGRTFLWCYAGCDLEPTVEKLGFQRLSRATDDEDFWALPLAAPTSGR
jgi:hypothetical protein